MDKQIERIVALALQEDIGQGDITTQAIYTGKEYAEAEFIAKQDGIIAGLDLARFVYHMLDESIVFETNFSDGDRILRGQLLATAKGAANVLLTGERTVLNFMQRMSGIATLTRQYVDKVEHTRAKILDTRKTAPGHRLLDKMAVTYGGGVNHRMRLDDRFLIKENHIAVAGSIPKAIHACMRLKQQLGIQVDIEIEVKNLDEVNEVLALGPGMVQYLMLDNMSLLDMQTAVERISGRILVEASGGVNLETVADIAETGVDFISVGALTHSVTAMDISLLFVL